MSVENLNITDYKEWINVIKNKIHEAKYKVANSINIQLLSLYWELGKEIDGKINISKWGTNIIDKISSDLKSEFPEIKGFSKRNLYAIRQWYKFYSENSEFMPQAVAQIPWGHNRLIISKIKDINTALFYSEQTAINGWNRDNLEIQIDNKLIKRVGSKSNNFATTLPKDYSKIASETLKDPYNFDFLGLESDAVEREIENEITKNITDFLLELGKGFAFVGRQYNIQISDNDYYIDLLFYHLELRCYVVIELKAGKFKPEYAGKLNFYLSAVDSLLKKKEDNLSIGILLCKKNDKIEAEYALRDINKPIGISEYQLTKAIPENIKSKLPSIDELEEKLKN